MVKSSKKWYFFIIFGKNYVLISLIGTYECKVDAKGRLPIPASLKKQLVEELENGFVLKRSVFQKCIEIHPMKNWEVVMKDLNKLNRFVKKNNDFIRVFTSGVKVVEIDGNSRLQISRDLITFAGIDKEVVLSSSLGFIELWDKNLYENAVSVDSQDFADIAEEIMGNLNNNE